MTRNTKVSARAQPRPRSASWSARIEGKRIAGLITGPEDGLPVLALHGWLDNAASFAALSAALPHLRMLAIDLPGHGLSDHRSADAGYQIWDDLPQIRGIIGHLGWEKCLLLGHSRGAMIATLFAATHPGLVCGLVTLDGLLPFPSGDEAVVGQLRSFLDTREKLAMRPPRHFTSIDEFVDRRSRAGEPPHIASALARRALRRRAEGYEFRSDPRLSGASAVKLNASQLDAVLAALEMPVLNIWATTDARYTRLMDAARERAAAHIADLTSVLVAGHHHWHMETGPAAEIAAAINRFLEEKALG